MRRIRSSQEMLIDRTDDADVDVITGWLYNGPLRRAKYEDFSTIDWMYDSTRSRYQTHGGGGGGDGILGAHRSKVAAAAAAAKEWIVLAAVGVAMGALATCVSVATQWLVDIKSGRCRTGLYLNRRFCCWNADDACLEWVTWSEQLRVRWVWAEWILQYAVFVGGAIVLAAASTCLVTEYAPYAAGQGIAEIKTIVSGFTMRRFLGARTLVVKSAGVALAVASGLSLGKEGTMVHIASCCCNVFTRAFASLRGNEVRRRELLSAASAAGISVAFGSPIAGVLFSLEQVSYYFTARTMWRSLFCAAAAAVTLKLFNPFRNGKLVPFQVTYDRTWDLFELWFFLAIGAAGGVIGALQNRLALFLMDYRQRTPALKSFARGEVVVAALVTAAISYPSVYLRADAVTLVSNLFTECTTSQSGVGSGLCSASDRAANVAALVITAAARVGLTAAACGLAVPGGMLLPSMATGASIGRAVGMVVQALYERHPAWRLFSACKPDVPCITPGVYALVGAASMLAATTRMTVTIVVIMFELTDALIYVLPIMLAVSASKAVADAIAKDGYFESLIHRNSYPFLPMDHDYVLRGSSDELMVRASELAVVCASGETLDSVADLLQRCAYSGFPVVRSVSTMALVGYISRADMQLAVDRAHASAQHTGRSPCWFGRAPVSDHAMLPAAVDFRPWVDFTPITIFHSTDLNLVAEMFRQLGVRYVLVCHHGVLLGIITKKDIVRAITIQGFKSYKDETTTDPLIGRNGSGKSNFFAAVRFVLSDAYTNLGREERQALLHEGPGPTTMSAFVEIVFDNSDNRFPTGKEETVVRRTVGLKKDDYSLDKKSSTKSEISSLLESAGFSRSNPYYIVPQGRVTSLTHAKDAERLALLKEVAGTKVYEARREASLKIIDDTERTRAKISEDLKLIEERLGELDSEKDELEKYRTLDRERRCLEYAIYTVEQEDVVEQLDEIDVRRESLVVAVNARQEACGDLERQTMDLEPEIRAAKQALEILRVEHEQLAREAEDHARTRAKVESAIQDLEQDRASGRDSITELRRSVDGLSRDVRSRESELATVEGEYARALESETQLREQFEVADQQRKSLLQKQGRSGHFASKAQRDTWLQNEIARLQTSVELHRAQVAATEEEQTELRGRLDEIQTAATAARAKADACAEQISATQAREIGIREERETKSSRRKELWRKQARLETEATDVREELKRAERALGGTVDRATGEGLHALPGIRERLGLSGVHGPLFELFEVDETYRSCVEAIAGASLFHVVVDSDDTASRIMDELSRRKLGRLTFMPLNRLRPAPATYPAASDAIPMIERLRFNRRYQRAFEQVFGRTIICPSLEVGSGYARSMNLTAVTLEGDKVDRRGELMGGFSSRKGSRLDAARALVRAQTRAHEAARQETEIAAEIVALDGEITALHSELQTSAARAVQAANERSAAKQELKQLATSETSAKLMAENAGKAVAALGAQLRGAEHELLALQTELGTPYARSGSFSAAERTQLEQLTVQADTQATELAQLVAARVGLEGRRNVLQNELGLGMRLRLEDAQRQLDQAVADNPDKAIGVRSRDLAKVAAMQEQIAQQLATTHREIEDKSREIADLATQLDETRARLDTETRRAQGDTEQLDKCLAQRNLYLQKKNEYTRNIQDLGVLPEEAFRSFNRVQLPKLAKKLHKTNEKLKTFGHVNKKAFEQFTIFARQREGIQQRKRELDQSAASIEELIEVLDQRKDEAIERTFSQVSRYFGEVFSKLVPAGRGSLVMQRRPGLHQQIQQGGAANDVAMDDDDDDDNASASVESYTGVGIRVSFNSTTDEGLQMQQLSGGQKSLVALALIFAIQQCDPAPFYLFDEIDANLDAVHRTAVADMIHELSRGSQFVTTTFRPEMLVHADKFYGVTFENKVSQISTITQGAAVSFIDEVQT
ncbi:Structural maintenance of chromosomes protein 3 [Coemansia sp. Benny D160-2]|nr:Structural maintenance of chromosomes protein 3 [Coemansia sp. Benny D160-2]